MQNHYHNNLFFGSVFWGDFWQCIMNDVSFANKKKCHLKDRTSILANNANMGRTKVLTVKNIELQLQFLGSVLRKAALQKVTESEHNERKGNKGNNGFLASVSLNGWQNKDRWSNDLESKNSILKVLTTCFFQLLSLLFKSEVNSL